MKRILLASFLMAFAAPAAADNIAACELVLMEVIEDESGQGGGAVASYRPAADFLADLYTDDVEAPKEIDGHKIRAVMCARNDIIPTKSDFKILATGIPFVLSQNYESPESDLLTYYFKDGEFTYQHKGPEMSGETQFALDKRVAYFNAQDHDLGQEMKAANDGENLSDEENIAVEDTPKQKELSMEKIRDLE